MLDRRSINKPFLFSEQQGWRPEFDDSGIIASGSSDSIASADDSGATVASLLDDHHGGNADDGDDTSTTVAENADNIIGWSDVDGGDDHRITARRSPPPQQYHHFKWQDPSPLSLSPHKTAKQQWDTCDEPLSPSSLSDACSVFETPATVDSMFRSVSMPVTPVTALHEESFTPLHSSPLQFRRKLALRLATTPPKLQMRRQMLNLQDLSNASSPPSPTISTSSSVFSSGSASSSHTQKRRQRRRRRRGKRGHAIQRQEVPVNEIILPTMKVKFPFFCSIFFVFLYSTLEFRNPELVIALLFVLYRLTYLNDGHLMVRSQSALVNTFQNLDTKRNVRAVVDWRAIDVTARQRHRRRRKSIGVGSLPGNNTHNPGGNRDVGMPRTRSLWQLD